MANRLNQKLRKPAQDKTAPVNYDSLHPASLTLPQQTADSRPTVAAVYRMLWPKLREERKLARSTARQYDRVMAQKVLPQMPLDVAFWDLDEDDFLKFWDHLCGSGLSQSQLQIASVVIRTIMELAYDQGLTQTTLWGLPQYRILPEDGAPLEVLPCENPEEEGERLADLAVRTPRSISLDVEFALAKGMIDNCRDHGELIAGLLMLCLGVRTSEATGFSYRHLKQIRPGYWALVRYEVSKQGCPHDPGRRKDQQRLPSAARSPIFDGDSAGEKAGAFGEVFAGGGGKLAPGLQRHGRCLPMHAKRGKRKGKESVSAGRGGGRPDAHSLPGDAGGSGPGGGLRGPGHRLSVPAPVCHGHGVLRAYTGGNLYRDGPCRGG